MNNVRSSKLYHFKIQPFVATSEVVANVTRNLAAILTKLGNLDVHLSRQGIYPNSLKRYYFYPGSLPSAWTKFDVLIRDVSVL